MSHRPGPAPLWIVLLLLQVSLYVFLIADRRLERGHATREAFESQRAVLLGASGPASADQGGLFHVAVRLPVVPRAGANALVLFHLGLFFDELIFLLGVWLLARRLYSDPRTAFFVSAAAIGSCLWVSNAGMNFRLFFALPLAVHLGLQFLRQGSPVVLFAVLNLAALQALGHPPGLALLTPLAALFLIAGLARLPDPAAIAWRWNARLTGAAIAGLLLWIPGVVYALGTGAASSGGGRSWGATALAATGLDAPANLLDVFLGLGPNLDYTLFCGFLTLAFAILGLAQLGPKEAAKRVGAAAAGMLILGLLAAPALHGARPSAVTAPLFRLCVAFAAGLGFDAALQGRLPRSTRAVAGALLVLAVALLALATRLSLEPRVAERAAALFAPREPGSLSPVFDTARVSELLDTSALWAGVAAGLLFLLQSRGRAVPLALALILFLHPLEMFSWKFRMTWLHTAALDSAAAQQHRLPDREGPRGGSAPVLLGLNAAAWLGWTLRKAGTLHRNPEREVETA